MKPAFILAVCLTLFAQTSHGAGGIFSRLSHGGMVRASGIRPNQIGTHEGVGMSSRSYEDARNNACYWGKRQALSVQYSKRGGMFYAVVRYK